MSKHHDECCYPMYGFQGGYGMGGYGMGGYGCRGGASGLSWFWALLILIVIILQFGRRRGFKDCNCNYNDGEYALTSCDNRCDNRCDNQLIDNSVLFIIIVFLLILCAGCFWGGGYGGYGGYGGGYGY